MNAPDRQYNKARDSVAARVRMGNDFRRPGRFFQPAARVAFRGHLRV
jgi:hypothetical protein